MNKLGSLVLPDDMLWSDEFISYFPVQYSEAYTISGNLVRQQGIKFGGRPISLSTCWATRDEVKQCVVMQEAGGVYELILHGSRSFNVGFIAGPAVIGTPILLPYEPSDDDIYTLDLKLIEVVV